MEQALKNLVINSPAPQGHQVRLALFVADLDPETGGLNGQSGSILQNPLITGSLDGFVVVGVTPAPELLDLLSEASHV